jgi:hypothetical protein
MKRRKKFVCKVPWSERTERDSYSTREQQKQWDEEVKAEQDWDAKPKAERVADARYVLRWSPAIAQTVIDGNVWMSTAIGHCQEIEKAIRGAGFESLEEMEEALAMLKEPK